MRIPLHIRDIDLEGLIPGQKEMALKLLTEEADSFAKDDNNVGCIPDLKLDLDLEDQTPVQKNYVAVPKPLYPEVKAYIEDLLYRNFIKKSSFSYSIQRIKRSKLTAARGFQSTEQKDTNRPPPDTPNTGNAG